MTHSQMSRAQADYYINRLRLFLNQTECAEEVNVSVMTWRRWEQHRGLPNRSMKPAFEKALMGVARRIARKAKTPATEFYARISDVLLADPCPAYTKPELPGVSIEYLHEQLIDRLYKNEVKSGDILDEFEEMGYTRMQIYHAANKLGVKRKHVVKGRNGYSLWRLPK